MAYKLYLNDKIYVAESADNHKITISLNYCKESDVKFFYDLENTTKKPSIYTNIKFQKITSSGVLNNCFCFLSPNEDKVQIHFDRITYK